MLQILAKDNHKIVSSASTHVESEAPVNTLSLAYLLYVTALDKPIAP